MSVHITDLAEKYFSSVWLSIAYKALLSLKSAGPKGKGPFEPWHSFTT